MGLKQEEEEEEEEEKKGEDERREEAIASSRCLDPCFNPKHVTHHQLSKLQELHNRRLKMKSKMLKKPKGGTDKFRGYGYKDSGSDIDGFSISSCEGKNEDASSSHKKYNVASENAPKKRQKLHWGLDTKERWERKANM